jgi:hypothetical protein
MDAGWFRVAETGHLLLQPLTGYWCCIAVRKQVDVFSFGIVLWEIWTLGEQPYPNKSLQEIFAGVLTGNIRPQIPPNCDPLWASLMAVSRGQTLPLQLAARRSWCACAVMHGLGLRLWW